MHAWMISHQLWGWIERVKNNSVEGLPGSAQDFDFDHVYNHAEQRIIYIYMCAWAPLQEFVRKAYWTVLCKTSCSACCAHRSTHVDLAERTALYAEVAPKGFWNALQQHDHCQPKMRWWDTVRHQPPNTDCRNSQISANIKGFSPVAIFFSVGQVMFSHMSAKATHNPKPSSSPWSLTMMHWLIHWNPGCPVGQLDTELLAEPGLGCRHRRKTPCIRFPGTRLLSERAPNGL